MTKAFSQCNNPANKIDWYEWQPELDHIPLIFINRDIGLQSIYHLISLCQYFTFQFYDNQLSLNQLRSEPKMSRLATINSTGGKQINVYYGQKVAHDF